MFWAEGTAGAKALRWRNPGQGDQCDWNRVIEGEKEGDEGGEARGVAWSSDGGWVVQGSGGKEQNEDTFWGQGQQDFPMTWRRRGEKESVRHLSLMSPRLLLPPILLAPGWPQAQVW